MAEVFERNETVVYDKNGVQRLAKIMSKHMDDYPNLYYTIQFEDGNEKQTDSKFLHRQDSKQPGVPPALEPRPATSFDITMLTAANFAQEQRSLEHELKQLGERSAIAQQLNGPITSAKKMVQNPDQVLFLARERGSARALGYIKFGPKDLFFYTKSGVVKSMRGQVCLLDFYVDDSIQRNGLGRLLFDEMIRYLNGPHPAFLAYDRPSPKLIGFMAKHFGLVRPDLQPNKYTIFEGFPIEGN
jgi:alpha-tubulin N-acetyltransferase 1